jgi:hypothetical protein
MSVVFDGAGKGDRPLANGVAGGSEANSTKKTPAARGTAARPGDKMFPCAFAFRPWPCKGRRVKSNGESDVSLPQLQKKAVTCSISSVLFLFLFFIIFYRVFGRFVTRGVKKCDNYFPPTKPIWAQKKCGFCFLRFVLFLPRLFFLDFLFVFLGVS